MQDSDPAAAVRRANDRLKHGQTDFMSSLDPQDVVDRNMAARIMRESSIRTQLEPETEFSEHIRQVVAEMRLEQFPSRKERSYGNATRNRTGRPLFRL